jgi:hypothetical protein
MTCHRKCTTQIINEIVKNDIKCLFEGKTRRCLMGLTVSRACVGLAEITMRPTLNKPKRRKNCDVLWGKIVEILY